jgi:hypothetical protein
MAISNGDRWLATSRIIDREPFMRFLSYAYRISSNFVFLALVYYSLNFLEKYQQRAIVAILVLILCRDAGSVSAAFVLFLPADRAARTGGATSRNAYRRRPRRIGRAQANRQRCRHHGGEMKSYIDLLFLTLIVVLCISKIVTS